MRIERLTPATDCAALAACLHPEEWDDANQLEPLDPEALRRIAAHPDYLHLFARPDDGDAIIGQLLATRLYKAEGTCWLYIDEVDTHPKWRRQGVATALLRAAMEQARAWGATEAWLGAERDNAVANAFYRRLRPSEVGEVIGYAWDLE